MNNIRIMRAEDLPAINDIYNQAVQLKFSTAHTDPISMKERHAWFREHEPEHYPGFVWDEEGVVLGWLSFSPYRPGRKALQAVAEISYYVHTDHHRSGIGTGLLGFAIRKAPELKFNTLIAILLEPNLPSIRLLRKFGFDLWGDIPLAAMIDGKEYNHQYYGLRIGE
jgi:phosphinothricin acetyltransferase